MTIRGKKIRADFEQKRRLVLAQIVDYLSKQNPVPEVSKIAQDDKIGWYLYNITRRNKPMRYILAKGYYYGEVNRRIAFVVDGLQFKPVDNFKYAASSRGLFIKIEDRQTQKTRLEKVCFVQYKGRF